MWLQNRKAAIAGCVLALILVGCGGSTSAEPAATSIGPSAGSEVVAIYVADQPVNCIVEGDILTNRDCLRMRSDPNEKWEIPTWEVDSIAGFDYEPGYVYHLRVEKVPLETVRPWDRPYSLRLIEVVDKQPAN